MKYMVSLDKLAKGVTIGVTILFAVIIGSQFLLIKTAGYIPVYISIALPLIYLFVFGMRPAGYEISHEQLVIRRILKDVIISRSHIKTVEMLDAEKISGSIRLFGVGGLFGYFGLFNNQAMGRMTWYATRRDHVVLVVTNDNKKIIVTPDDPAAFVAGLKP